MGTSPTRYPGGRDVAFADLLQWHLEFGMRPDGNVDRPGRPWSKQELADVSGLNIRSINNWVRGQNLPSLDAMDRIATTLFGEEPEKSDLYLKFRQSYFEQLPNKRKSANEILHGDVNEGRPFEGDQLQSISRLPRLTPYFVGRRKEVEQILDVLGAAKPSASILLQGMPGVGKSTLAVAVAWHPAVVDRFGDNRRYVGLETAATAEQMCDAIARAIGSNLSHGLAGVMEHLGGEPTLLILDNLETPWESRTERHETEEILATIASLPNISLLASFRGRERVGGIDWALIHTVDVLSQDEARSLFYHIAGRRNDEDPFVEKFVDALGGVPLAIDLVARRAFGFARLDRLWAQWIKVGSQLAERPNEDPARLTSLEHSIEISLRSNRMTPRALRLFAILGQLPAGLAIDDLDGVLGEDAFDAGEALLRAGLAIERHERVDLLPPVRDFAARNYPVTPVDGKRWIEYYLEKIKQLDAFSGAEGGREAIARIQFDFANVEAAFRAAASANLLENAMEGVSTFGFLATLGSSHTSVFAELALECRSRGDVRGEADCRFHQGNIAFNHLSFENAQEAYLAALAGYQSIDSVLGEINCTLKLGNVAFSRSEYDRAGATYEEALAGYRRIGDVLGETNCIMHVGDVAAIRADYEGSMLAYQQALPLYRRIGDLLGEANCLMRLGNVAFSRSDFEEARAAYEAALQLYRDLGDVTGVSSCSLLIGDLALERADHGVAVEAYKEAAALFRQVANAPGVARSLLRLADAMAAQGNGDAAERLSKEARDFFRLTPTASKDRPFSGRPLRDGLRDLLELTAPSSEASTMGERTVK